MDKYMDNFLEHRRAQERTYQATIAGSSDPITSLLTVELNITELCNRICPFCPRVNPEVYPNLNLSMDLKISEKIAEDLKQMGYKGRISFSGYGEPILNKQFPDHIRLFRRALPENTIETNTNGDKLTVDMIQGLYDAGISALYVNLYDGVESVAHFEDLFAKAGIITDRYKLRRHWPGVAKDYGLTINNRSGMLQPPDAPVQQPPDPIASPCYYPFYKMLVDWNGNVLFCANDWGRKNIIGNLLHASVRELWLSDRMREIRLRLAKADRHFSPCNVCDIEGTLHGKPSFDRLLAFYADD
ncbi:MAG: SPASM domain-containing protein [Magnetococcales bacterium]|nr:SPASM domain-containing protein [Magnetococcales bacterium]